MSGPVLWSQTLQNLGAKNKNIKKRYNPKTFVIFYKARMQNVIIPNDPWASMIQIIVTWSIFLHPDKQDIGSPTQMKSFKLSTKSVFVLFNLKYEVWSNVKRLQSAPTKFLNIK